MSRVRARLVPAAWVAATVMGTVAAWAVAAGMALAQPILPPTGQNVAPPAPAAADPGVVAPRAEGVLPPVATNLPHLGEEDPEKKAEGAAAKQPPGADREEGKKSVKRGDDSRWPIKADLPAPPPRAPLPGLPPAYGMGGFPGAPEKSDEPRSLQQFIKDNLGVQLRGGGLLRPYGFFRGDLDVATARMSLDLQNPFFVLPNDSRFRFGPTAVPVQPNDLNYALYPRLTRLGLEYYGESIDWCCSSLRPSGRVEIDFLTPAVVGNSESRELLRLRLAYAALQWQELTLLIGQDWDLIAPLNPTINDNTLMWNAGNLGDRRPQFKLMWDHDLGGGQVLQLYNAIVLADAINNADLDGNGLRDQEDFGVPGYQARAGLVLPSHVEKEKIFAGVWGMVGFDEVDGRIPAPPIPPQGLADPTFSSLKPRRFRSSGVGADLRLPLSECVTFQGEVWYGENMDDYRGGISQGINVQRQKVVRAAGGWGELVWRLAPWYQLGVGATIDRPTESDVEGINLLLFPGFPQGVDVGAGRTLNWTCYVSNRFPLGKGLTVGMDYIYWNTEYVGFKAGHASLAKFFVQQAF